MGLTSYRWPIAGILLIWGFYGCFALLGTMRRNGPSPAEKGGAGRDARSPAAVNVAKKPEPMRGRRDSPPKLQDESARPEAAPKPAPTKGAASSSSAEDAEFLEVISSSSDPQDLARLEAFVAAHPDHALSRAVLIACLFENLLEGETQEDPTLRAHVEALQKLLPDAGLPDIVMASLELIAGRDDAARELLLDAVKKDLTWHPDGELFRLKIRSELGAGVPSLEALAKIAGWRVPFHRLPLEAARRLLPSDEPQTAAGEPVPRNSAVRIETARAILKLGAAMQEHGIVIIENLVGISIALNAAREIEKAGELGVAERAIVTRCEAIRGEARLIGPLTQEILLSNPAAAKSYLENLVEHGELKAARRGFMDYLAWSLRER